MLARSTGGSRRHTGLSYLLVPMDQPGIEVRPITQLTGGIEFNETFFNDAVTAADLVVGGEGNGWKVAMGTLAFERGASTLGQQISFRQEFDALVHEARSSGRIDCDVLRDELVQCHIELEILRFNHMRLLTSLTHDAPAGPEQSIGKPVLGLLAPAPGRAGREGEGRSGDGRRHGRRRPHRRGRARLSARPLAAARSCTRGPTPFMGEAMRYSAI